MVIESRENNLLLPYFGRDRTAHGLYQTSLRLGKDCPERCRDGRAGMRMIRLLILYLSPVHGSTVVFGPLIRGVGLRASTAILMFC
jgi:hypothetical protein